MAAKNYQVGKFLNPVPTDLWFEDMESAERVAEQLAAKDSLGAIAIWDGACDVQRLYLNGHEFKEA